MIIVVIIKVAPQLLSGDFPSKEKTSYKIKLTSIRKRFTNQFFELISYLYSCQYALSK